MGMLNKFATGFVTAAMCFSAQAVTRLELDSYGRPRADLFDPSVPWMRLGTTAFTTADGNFSLTRPYSSNPDYANSVGISYLSNAGYTQGSRWINVTFSTDKLGVPLDVGFYPGAQRFPFSSAGHPGLDLTDTGAGFNTLDGQFQVFDIKRNTQGAITAFAASFEIFGYPGPVDAPLTGGRIWYNSDAVISSVPEANSGLLLAMGMLVVLAVASKCRKDEFLSSASTWRTE